MNKPDVFFEICNLKWERIFLSLEVQTNCKDNATFSLERIGKIIHEEQEGTESVRAEVLEKSRFPMKRKRMDVIIFS